MRPIIRLGRLPFQRFNDACLKRERVVEIHIMPWVDLKLRRLFLKPYRFDDVLPLSLVPTSDITIIIIIISSNITLLCRLCLSGNVQKHNHKRPYDQHNHNHKKMIDHFLMIMIMSVTMTMLLFFLGTRKS